MPGPLAAAAVAAGVGPSSSSNPRPGGLPPRAAVERSTSAPADSLCVPPPPPPPRLAIFSGGTAVNSVASRLRRLTTEVAYILPVSDDGGSTAEIVRVLGGPAVGDIRSRCLRLADDGDAEAVAVRRLLAHRLPAHCGQAAKAEWAEIVEGDHPLWGGVSEPYKHTIRAFLVHFHTEVLRHSSERFSFRHGSVGNFFFAGARLFFRSLEAAIFVFSRVARIPDGSDVLPAVCTEERLVLAALLADGSVLRGQNEISHPTTRPPSAAAAPSPGPLAVDKGAAGRVPLAAPIVRVFYAPSDRVDVGGGDDSVFAGLDGLNLAGRPLPLPFTTSGGPPGGELSPPANPRALAALARADAVVYGMGSLYTSVLPALILEGVGEAVAGCRGPKILLLNGGVDRETGAALVAPASASSSSPLPPRPMTAVDVADAVARALARARPADAAGAAAATPRDLSPFITAAFYPAGTSIAVDAQALAARGVARVVAVASKPAPEGGGGGGVVYDPDALVDAIAAEVGGWAGGVQ